MRKAARRLFNLYPGEGRGAFPFLILGFLWSIGAFGCLTLSEGMFLEHVGAKGLPFSYLITAFVMCLFSSVLLLLLHKRSITHLLSTVITGVIVCYLGIYFFITSGIDTISLWYIFKIVGWVSPVAIYICFWAFIDQYYDLQAAKRCFCLFNSVLYLGDAFAGGVISYSLHRIGLSGLIFFCSVSLILSIPLIFYIERKKKTVSEESQDGNPPHNRFSVKPFIKKVLSSPFTLLLMLFYFLMQLIAITTEYTYMDSFEHHFEIGGHPYTLTEFLGRLAMWVSLGNMLFGLFFYSRTVTRIGVNNIILIAPLCFLSIFFSWSWTETLLLATIALVAREGMSYTFDDNNLLLLISGVPSKVKNQVRISIESFFEPIGLLVGAALLFFFQSHSKWLGFGLAISSLIVAIVLRSHYTKAIFNNLMAHTLRFEKKTKDWIASFSKKEKKRVETELLTYLKKNDELLQLLSFEYLLKMENSALLPRLLGQASRFSIRGKLRVIELFSASTFSHETIVLERLDQWRKMLPHPSVRSSIYFYFAEHRFLKREQMMPYLESEELPLKGAAILILRTFPEKIAHSLTALEKLKGLLQSSIEKEIVMGLTILGVEKKGSNVETILPFLLHTSITVARTAAKSLSLCCDSGEWGQVLVEHLKRLKDGEVRAFLLQALQKVATPSLLSNLIEASVHFRPSERKQIERIILTWGKETIDTLLELCKNTSLHVRCRLLAGKILGKLSLSDFSYHLKSLLLPEIENALFYLHYAKTLESKWPEKDLGMLKNALESSFQSTFDFIVQMIAVGGSFEESDVLSFTIQSKNRKIRAHAIETLEKAADPLLLSLILPLLHQEKIAHHLKKDELALTLENLLFRLASSPSIANQLVAATFKEKMITA